MPQPEKKRGPSNPAATSAARSGRTMPVNSSCPAFEARTRHGRLAPSSASAYVPRSAHQKASSKRSARRLASASSSARLVGRCSRRAQRAIAVFAAKT